MTLKNKVEPAHRHQSLGDIGRPRSSIDNFSVDKNNILGQSKQWVQKQPKNSLLKSLGQQNQDIFAECGQQQESDLIQKHDQVNNAQFTVSQNSSKFYKSVSKEHQAV